MGAVTTRKGAAGRTGPALILAASLALGGCLGGEPASRSALAPDQPAPARLDGRGEVISPLIEELRLRRSILPPGSAFAEVAAAVLSANAATAEAELRVKRLTARARSKNWLPTLGPDVTLSSLGAVAARLLLEQAVFDNGRRKAERDFAAADVEVAAVALATDLNQRVHDGLKLHIEVQRAQELAAISQTALIRMADFDRIMRIRVDGGLSDGSEYRIVSQKKAEMEATLSSERQGAAAALAELEAITRRPTAIVGLTTLPPDSALSEPLSVLLARGEAARSMAEVRLARAALMPGFGASAQMDRDGGLDGGLSLDGEGLGFGRKDSLAALEASEEATRRKVDEAARDADRRIVALEQEIAALALQEVQDGRVVAGMEANLGLFTEQYRAGRMSLIELVGQFESLISAKRDRASLKYQMALARVEIGLLRGVLVDGASM